jgi:hypothetical protein
MGLHLYFDNSSRYGTFVQAIDILKMENAKTYMPIENDIWIYYLPPDPVDSTVDSIKAIYL